MQEKISPEPNFFPAVSVARRRERCARAVDKPFEQAAVCARNASEIGLKRFAAAW
jgi:hypothetical protein